MLTLFLFLFLRLQDFLKYYTKAGMDTEELEVGVFTDKYRL